MLEKNANNIFLPLRPHVRWLVAGIAVAIGLGSIIYTNSLVNKLKKREQKQIDIYASSLEFLAAEQEASNFYIIFEEIVKANETIPVVLTSEDGNPEDYRNIPQAEKIDNPDERSAFLKERIAKMKAQHDPIEVVLSDGKGTVYGYKYIYYQNSRLLSQLTFYPYIQLSIIGVFGVIIFMVLNYVRRSEQNRVWVGLAKETAHQLGTPLSSLMALSAYFKELFPDQKEALAEFDKDVDRLNVITQRFSSIGSEPQVKLTNIVDSVYQITDYLKKRLSTKIETTITSFPNDQISAFINPSLFAWVIENICKNAADAMEGVGSITINILQVSDGRVAVDITDTGRGMTKSQMSDVFRPGFTTKKRGWGLGLTLAKRIIEQYHKGKIFVKHSEPNKGTTFRIYLVR